MGKTWVIHANGLKLHRGRPCRWLPRGKSQFFVYLGRFRYTLTASSGKGICVVARSYRGEVPRGAVRDVSFGVPSMKRKLAKGAVGGDAKHLAAMETQRFTDLMPLVEHCAMRQYDDGEPRETGWVTIKTIGAAWCVQVKDPDACVSFTSIADTLDKALETAALLLACDEAPWEQDRFLTQQKAGKKK